jgi:O-antigen ligase
MLLGLLPFAPFHLYMAFISWPTWPGYVQGTEIWVLDALALALMLSMRGTKCPLPFQLPMLLYFSVVLLSTLEARTPIPALFYPWQLGRMFLMYATVTRGVYTDPRVAPALLKGMAAGLIMEAVIAIWQRFGLGILQVSGTFEAQNSLGLISHFFVYPFFALLLWGASGWLPILVTLAGMVTETLTASRATLGIAGLGFAAVFMVSAFRKWNSPKMLVLLIGAVTIPIIVSVVLSSLAQREIGNSPAESDREREAFIRAAGMILSDHPFGIGSDQYLVIANMEGYLQAAGVPPKSRTSIVHNVYLLVATETGYLGLITFVFLLLRPLTVAVLCGWRNRGDERGVLLLGLGVALLAVYIHSYFEWIFLQPEPQYMFAQDVGLVAGLAQRFGYWRRPYRKLSASRRDQKTERAGGAHPDGRPTSRPGRGFRTA